MRIVLLLLLLHFCVVPAAAKKTRRDGKPPGWRPDQPTETGIAIVERMLRKLGSEVVSGKFFYDYQKSMKDMHAANEDTLRPASLLPEGMATQLDDQDKASLKGAQAGFEWQAAQVEILETFERSLEVARAEDLRAKDLQYWPLTVISKYLLVSGVIDDEELPKLSSEKRLSVAKDLAKLHRIFRWTFENMPDDEEAKQITQKINAEQGLPPPSPPPPPPPGQPAEPPRTRSRPRRGKKAHKRRRKDEL